jgi:hypothetical protein
MLVSVHYYLEDLSVYPHHKAVLEFKQSMGARDQVEIMLSYRPARLHRLAESIFLESIPGLHKSLKIRAQVVLTQCSAVPAEIQTLHRQHSYTSHRKKFFLNLFY